MHAIGEAARRSGLGIDAIRFYERAGLLPSPGRGASGRRLYAEADIRRMRFVRRCRELGFPLGEVRGLLALAGAPEAACVEAARLAGGHLSAVRDRLRDLAALEAALAALVAGCGGAGAACPVLADLLSGDRPVLSPDGARAPPAPAAPVPSRSSAARRRP